MTFHFDPARYADYPVHQTRRQLAEEIERMIDFLDSLEPDTDDEESLGWCIDFGHGGCSAQCFVSRPADLCDLEGDEHDGREPDVDDEPAGWTECTNQDCSGGRLGGGWMTGEDMEPHLGWSTALDQSGDAFMGCAPTTEDVADLEADDADDEAYLADSRVDLEHDDAEMGIADRDALDDPEIFPQGYWVFCWHASLRPQMTGVAA